MTCVFFAIMLPLNHFMLAKSYQGPVELARPLVTTSE